MKKLGTLLLIAVILLAGCSSQEKIKEEPVAVNKITAEEAKTMIESGGKNLVVLDVRTLEEFNTGHIQNAVLLPDTEIGAKAPDLLTDTDQTILVYCRTGRRSAAAAKKLVDMGYTNIYDFGGIVDWPYAVIK